MNNIKSFRWLFFVMTLGIFWLFTPLVLGRFLTPEGEVLSPLWLVGGLLFAYFAAPKVNAWLVVNTPFGRVWTWARAKE
jgi:hypothetical protein